MYTGYTTDPVEYTHTIPQIFVSSMRKLCCDLAKAPGCHLTLEWIEKQTGEEERLVVEEQAQGMQDKTFLPTVEWSK